MTLGCWAVCGRRSGGLNLEGMKLQRESILLQNENTTVAPIWRVYLLSPVDALSAYGYTFQDSSASGGPRNGATRVKTYA
jgi:hypothetical protein